MHRPATVGVAVAIVVAWSAVTIGSAAAPLAAALLTAALAPAARLIP